MQALHHSVQDITSHTQFAAAAETDASTSRRANAQHADTQMHIWDTSHGRRRHTQRDPKALVKCAISRLHSQSSNVSMHQSKLILILSNFIALEKVYEYNEKTFLFKIYQTSFFSLLFSFDFFHFIFLLIFSQHFFPHFSFSFLFAMKIRKKDFFWKNYFF